MNAHKIGFVLASNSRRPLPSTRIAVLNMLPFLRAAGFDPSIVYEPPSAIEQPDMTGVARRVVEQGFGTIFFQKVVGPSVEAMSRELAQAGVKTVFGVCDLIDEAMVEATDATVAVTDFLRGLYPPHLQAKIYVVHDGIEHPDLYKTEWSDGSGSAKNPMKAVLVTSLELTCLPAMATVPPWLRVSIVGNYPGRRQVLDRLRRFRWAMDKQDHPGGRAEYLRFLVNRRIRRVVWHAKTVYDEMQRADIGIIPIDTPAQPAPCMPVPTWMVKSGNRLTLMMAMGLPVIATPIPAYEAILQHGVNGFFAHSPADWARCLEALRDPALRRRVGEQARRSVLEPHSTREQARRLIQVLSSLAPHGVQSVASAA